MHFDTSKAPNAAIPDAHHLYAMWMMDVWARDQGYSGPAGAAYYLAPRIGVADLLGRFTSAGQHLAALLRPEDCERTWTLRRVLDEICQPFALWAGMHAGRYDWPSEPAVRQWLQMATGAAMVPPTAHYAEDQPLVVAVAVHVDGKTHAQAVAATVQRLTAGTTRHPLTRYWVTTDEDDKRHDGSWFVDIAVEVVAANLAGAYGDACAHMTERFGPAGRDWNYNDAEGNLVSTGTFARVAGPVQPACFGMPALVPAGSLPPHMR